jgi:hypothetical protein
MTDETEEWLDVTPTWQGILPHLLDTYCNGIPKNREIAEAELIRMAGAADAYNAKCKEKAKEGA